MIFDVHWLDVLDESGQAGLARSARMSRATKGARVVRLARLLRLVRVVKLFRLRARRVEDDDDQLARPRRRDHLAPAPLAVLRALDDPRQVEQLDPRSAVVDHPRDARQRRELVRRRL